MVNKRQQTIVITATTAVLLMAIGVMIGYWVSSLPPSGMESVREVRTAVKGKSVSDVKQIVLNAPYLKEPKTVTNRVAITAMIEGMQEALQTEKQYGNRTENVTIAWKDGTTSGPFGYSGTDGWKHAFSKEFALGRNLAYSSEQERWIDISY